MDVIRLKNVALFAHHGVAPQEQELGQHFFLDIELVADLSDAARSDELDRSIDYDAVYQAATGAFTSQTCKLIERAAWQVLTALFRQFPAQEITVRVRKPSAPIEGVLDTVEVELSRRREELPDG